MRFTLLALALALPASALAADKLENWNHGQATIYTHNQAGPVAVGQVKADGQLVFDWPVPADLGQTLGDTYPPCDGTDMSPVSAPEAGFWPTSLFIGKDESTDGELGSLHLASSAEVMAWQSSYGQKDAADGTWFQYVYVGQPASVETQCRMPTYTGEGEDGYEQVTEYNLYFEKGWNLMRNDITRLHAAPSGKKHAASTRVSVQQGPAEDARWFFQAY